MTDSLSSLYRYSPNADDCLFPEVNLLDNQAIPSPTTPPPQSSESPQEASDIQAVSIKVEGVAVTKITRKRGCRQKEPAVTEDPEIDLLKQAKIEARRENNRLAAQASRNRKKQYVEYLIAQNQTLQASNSYQAMTITVLQNRLEMIRQKLALCTALPPMVVDELLNSL
jgi:hypothetical protein